MSEKRLLVITSALKTPSFRYRIGQHIPYLEKAGFDTQVVEMARIGASDLSGLRDSLAQSKVILLQKKLLKRTEAPLLRPMKNKIIFDFDDAVFLPAFDETTWFFKRWRRHRKFVRALRASALVICASDYLAGVCRNLAFEATVIPTAVPLDRYYAGPVSRGDGTFMIGWIGTGPNLRYLNVIRPVLKRLNEKFPIVLKVISSEAPAISECPVAFKRWRWEDEADDLASLDVGIMPLTDDPWTRGKAGFKALQYMAAGLPAVCSNVGANREIIQHGENGFLVNTLDEWVEVLGNLAFDKDLRRRIGEKARARVAQKYSLEVIAPRVVEAISHFT